MSNSTVSVAVSTTSIPPTTISSTVLSTSTNGPSTIFSTSTATSTQPPSTSTSSIFSSSAPETTSTTQQTIAVTTSPPSTALITSVVTAPAASDGSSVAPATIIITSTSPAVIFTPGASSRSSSSTSSSSTSSGAAALATNGTSTQSTSGITAGGKIAVAVVVPVVAVALIVLALLFFWRRRKQRKDAEELRRKEVEDYGYNPNTDPTLPVVGENGSPGDESEMKETDGAGYRGWGTTPANRKASTTLSSGNGLGAAAIGVARSGSESDQGGYYNGSHGTSPTAATAPNSEVQSGDPLVTPSSGRPLTGDSETIGALGAAPVTLSHRQERDIHRGPSNASSAYSGGHRSDTSGDVGIATSSPPTNQYYNEGMYYDENTPQHGPYRDGTYGGVAQPVIRDVQARRNTRIENPSIRPQQGNAGIAQNF